MASQPYRYKASRMFTIICVLMMEAPAAQCSQLHTKSVEAYRPNLSLTSLFLKQAMESRLVSPMAMIIKESEYSEPYEAVVVLQNLTQSFPSGFYLSVFDISNKDGQTWYPLRSDLDFSQQHQFCTWDSSLTHAIAVSPSRRDLFIFVSSAMHHDNCPHLFAWRDGKLSVVDIQNVDVVQDQANTIATIQLPDDNKTGTFRLVTFGGGRCTSQQCDNFSNQMWMITFPNGSLSQGKWVKIMPHNNSTSMPQRRIAALLFSRGSSLLLHGGLAEEVEKTKLPYLHLCDIWTYDFNTRRWRFLGLIERDCEYNTEDIRVVPAATYIRDMDLFVTSGCRYNAAWRTYGFEACITTINITHTHQSQGLNWQHHMFEFTYVVHNNKYPIIGTPSKFYLMHRATKKICRWSSTGQCSKLSDCCTVFPSAQNDQYPGGKDCISSDPISVDPTIPGQSKAYILFGGVCLKGNENYEHGNVPVISLAIPVWTLMIGRRDEYIAESRAKAWYTKKIIYPYPDLLQVGITALRLSGSMCVLQGVYDVVTPSHNTKRAMHCYHTRLNYWIQNLPTSKDQPCPVYENVAFRHNDSSFIIHGGKCLGRPSNQIWIFSFTNITTCTGYWLHITQRVIGGVSPAIYGHTATVSDTFAILFGGKGDFASNSLIVLETATDASVVTLTTVPVLPSLPSRFGHSLSWYSKNSLLLLGGMHSQYPNSAKLTKSSIITLNTSSLTNAGAINFFVHKPISHHKVTDNVVFSGYRANGCNINAVLIFSTLLCPLGYGKPKISDDCHPCPVGFLSATLSQHCHACPNFSTTHTTGATACYVPSPCTDNFCNGNGNCFNSNNDSPAQSHRPSAYCKCSFGYLPYDNCKVPVVYLIQLATVLLVLIIVFTILGLRMYLKKNKDLEKKEIELKQKHRDWRVAQKKVDQLNTGTRIQWSDLQIKKTLAKGRFNRVYLAELSDMNVVVKRFPSYFIPSSPCDEFVQEAETLRSMRHPNIVFFLGAGKDPKSGRPFLVTEYLRRGSLYNVLHDDDCDISHPDVIRFALDAAKGMRYLHGSNPPRVHRDLKSPNLLVSDKWVVKVGDLETARFLAILDVQQHQQQQLQLQQPQTNRPSSQEATNGQSIIEAETQLTCNQETVQNEATSGDLSTPLLTNVTTCHGETYQRYSMQDTGHMTTGVGTSRWRSPESLKDLTYDEKSDIYRLVLLAHIRLTL